jgi:hypothetical protein
MVCYRGCEVRGGSVGGAKNDLRRNRHLLSELLVYWLGALYTTIPSAYGNPIKHYGDFDVALKVNQVDAIKQFLS